MPSTSSPYLGILINSYIYVNGNDFKTVSILYIYNIYGLHSHASILFKLKVKEYIWFLQTYTMESFKHTTHSYVQF